MENMPKIFESEYRFCLILWENEPINSGELAKLAKEKLGWSKTTTYTVIKRLSERGNDVHADLCCHRYRLGELVADFLGQISDNFAQTVSKVYCPRQDVIRCYRNGFRDAFKC